ncbi:uncharacterized protein LOC120007908 [Tripterygium wilfordii]|uniref:uncharacterized protein LOC120007908 n=1 Tax=Tripterygium wilfordii TaxID=458696 RepID=UPI0018F86259|nr:uncharacterized protein LOC120007908 [Tripterygium wilfordii]
MKVGSIVCPLSKSKTETSAAAVNLVEEKSTVCPLSDANPETSAAPVNQVEEGCTVCSLSNSNPQTKTGKFIKLGSFTFTCLLSKTNSETSAAAVNLVEAGSTVCPLSNAKSETSAAAVNNVEEGSTVCPLSNADPETSAVAVNQVEEGSTVCPLSNANPEKNAAPVNRIKTGSILFPEPYCSANNPEVIFEFLESEQLQQRKPFLKKIEELFEVGSSNHPMYGDAQKLYSSLHDIHPASWFSVAWYPEGDFNASFLTYHSLGHLVEKLITPIDLLQKEETSVIAFPVLGLASHNAQVKCDRFKLHLELNLKCLQGELEFRK